MNKLTKQQIISAYNKLTTTSTEVNSILEKVNDVIDFILFQAYGASFFLDGKCFCLREGHSVVSTFGNFIDLFFVLQKKLQKSWYPDNDLTPEEKAADIELFRQYRKGEIRASQLWSSLNSTVNNPCIRIRLEPSIDEVADIYDTRRLSIDDDKDYIIIAYGKDHVLKLPKAEE